MTIQFLFALISMFLAPVHAEENVSAADYLSATQEITAILRSRIFILDRELMTFHYEHFDPSFSPSTTNDLAEHLSWQTQFYDLDVISSETGGPGIYSAIDSLSSRDWGWTENPHLYVVPMKKGTRVVAFTKKYSPAEIAAIRRLSDKFTCYVRDPERAPIDWEKPSLLWIFRGSQNVECRKMVIRAFSDLKIQAVIYPWTASNSLSGCRKRNEAFSILDPGAVNMNSLALFSNTVRIEGRPLGALAIALMREAARDEDLIVSIGKSEDLFPKSILKDTFSDADYQKWKQSSIFKCGNEWSAEKLGLVP